MRKFHRATVAALAGFLLLAVVVCESQAEVRVSEVEAPAAVIEDVVQSEGAGSVPSLMTIFSLPFYYEETPPSTLQNESKPAGNTSGESAAAYDELAGFFDVLGALFGAGMQQDVPVGGPGQETALKVDETAENQDTASAWGNPFADFFTAAFNPMVFFDSAFSLPAFAGPTTTVDIEDDFCVVRVDMSGLPKAAVTDVSASESGIITVEYSYSSSSSSEEKEAGQGTDGEGELEEAKTEKAKEGERNNQNAEKNEENNAAEKRGNLRGTNNSNFDGFDVAAVYSATEFVLDPQCDAASPMAKAAMDNEKQIGLIKFPLRSGAAATAAEISSEEERAAVSGEKNSIADGSSTTVVASPSASSSTATTTPAKEPKAAIQESSTTPIVLDMPKEDAAEAVERRNAHRLPIVTMNEF